METGMPIARSILTIGAIALFQSAVTMQVAARTEEGDLCRAAAAHAADQTGVPYDVLLAISVVETGRNGQPWPWTVNLGGTGHWPETPEAAETLVQAALDQGMTNIDLGCFQLNMHWHARGFASIRDMLDPTRNALYAAEFLASHYAEKGDWTAAAAAYHSATPEHAERYAAQFSDSLAALGAGQYSTPTTLEENRFPLLLAGNPGSPGSIVPQTGAGLRLIGGP